MVKDFTSCWKFNLLAISPFQCIFSLTQSCNYEPIFLSIVNSIF
jgi:hypothetical protein